MKRFIWIALLLLTPVFCSPVFGCVCSSPPELTPEQGKENRFKAFDLAAAVFTGEVIKVKDGRATLKLYRIWKGEQTDEMVIKMYDVNPDGTIWATDCHYFFRVGEKHLVYAYDYKKDVPCGHTDAAAQRSMNA